MARLGRALRARDMRVSRIHLCPGDWLMWRGGGGRLYRGATADWPAYVRAFMQAKGVTDLICLGSGRAYHRAAIASAPDGVRVTSIEHGYLRPGLLLAEPGGGGGDSSFPRDWATLKQLATGAPPDKPAAPFRSSFLEYAILDIIWNLSNTALSWAMTPGYQRHSVDHPLIEYGGWVSKALCRPRRRRELVAAQARLAAHRGPVFLLPLQLETDFQIRRYGTGDSMREELARLIGSFAARAPGDALLAVKVHPLDNGNTPWANLCRQAAASSGVAARVLFFDGGDLSAMIARSSGVVTINSTVGLTALLAGRPVQVLGSAIYDLPGLTHQGSVGKFWNRAAAPDPEYVELFEKALLASIHVYGAFDGSGAGPGAEAIADTLMAPPPYPVWNRVQNKVRS